MTSRDSINMIVRENEDLQTSDIFTVPGTNEVEPLETVLVPLDDLPSSGQEDGRPSSSVAELRISVDKLFNELEELAKKHQVERSQCLAGWLRRQESVHAWCGPDALEKQVTPQSHVEPAQISHRGRATAPAAPINDRRKIFEQAMKQTKLLGEPEDERSNSDKNFGKAGTTNTLTQGSRKKSRKKKKAILSSAESKHEKNRLQEFTTSRAYEIVSALLIAINSVTIGWQVQWSCERAKDKAWNITPQETENIFFDVVAALFTIAFTIELGLRWVADGFLEFFRTDDFAWCIFDVLIVGVGLIELFLGLIFTDGMPLAGEITLLRILRVMRIVKVLRVIRVMRFFRELRMMIWSIAGSIKSLMWVMLVLALLFYIFGILITQGVETFLSDSQLGDISEHKDLVDSFATLDRAMLALFMAMSGGNDWSLYYLALLPLSIHYRIMFLIFIVFSIFAVVNIVTGVFVQSAMNSSSQDREIVVHEELECKRQYCEAMREFFEEVDEDGSGMIGYSEFTDKLDDERVLAYFNALKLDVSDADTLFKLLDFDNSGEVDIDEFLVGCHKLQGESRNLDMKVMQLEVRWMQGSLDKLVAGFNELIQPEATTDQHVVQHVSLSRTQPSEA